MTLPLVDQLMFARREFVRGLKDVTGEEARRRFGAMNCISWIVGHLAWQEQRYWLWRVQGQMPLPEINEKLAYGQPPCQPTAEEMWSAWEQITQAADPWLAALTPDRLRMPLAEGFSSVGTFLQRNIYHYWYHLGEGMAVRQMLGHTGLPDFVGDIDGLAPYRPETGERPLERCTVPELIAQVQDARERLENVLIRVGEPHMTEPGVDGDWSCKDVIAHLTWHEREMLGVLRRRALAGSDLWNRPQDERNRAIYELNKDRPIYEVRAEAREVFTGLLQEMRSLNEDDLHEPGRLADFPPDWRLSDLLLDNTVRHYVDHRHDVEIWLSRRSAP